MSKVSHFCVSCNEYMCFKCWRLSCMPLTMPVTLVSVKGRSLGVSCKGFVCVYHPLLLQCMPLPVLVILSSVKGGSLLASRISMHDDNNNDGSHFPAHVLGVCGPASPGWLVLSITVRTVDVELLKIRQTTRIAPASNASNKLKLPMCL